MAKETIDTTNKFILPANGDVWSEEARRQLIEDLQKITPEDINALSEAIAKANDWTEVEKLRFDEVWSPVEIWWKPAFWAKKDWKEFIMRGEEKYSEDFDEVWSPVEIWWNMVFKAKRDWKWFIKVLTLDY